MEEGGGGGGSGGTDGKEGSRGRWSEEDRRQTEGEDLMELELLLLLQLLLFEVSRKGILQLL